MSVDRVLGIHGFDLQRALAVNPQLLNPDKARTQHDASVASVSINQAAPRHLRTVNKGDLDHELAQEFLQYLLETAGEDLFRMKGVLAVAHARQKFVYHSVHMTFSGEFQDALQPGEARESKMVFIGKNLDEQFLTKTFNACLATPENLQRKASTLRCALGNAVFCATHAGVWTPGTVIGLLIPDERMPQGMTSPYQVRLEDGSIINVPTDCESVIRRVHNNAEGETDMEDSGDSEMEEDSLDE